MHSHLAFIAMFYYDNHKYTRFPGQAFDHNKH